MTVLFILNPLIHILIGMVFLVITKKKRKSFAIFLTLYFYLISITFTSHWISGLWEVADTYKSEEKYEAVCVLAGVIDVSWHDAKESLFYVPKNYIKTTSTTERILAGLYFLKSGHASQLLFGEWTYYSVNEAEKVKMFLMSHGVDEEKIVLYAKVNRTLDEARGVKAYVEKKQLKKLLLVTSAVHMRRAIALFKKVGLTPDIFSTNKWTSSDFSLSSFVPSLQGINGTLDCIYELSAYGFYLVRGDLLL
ncbi:MAG: YdcF family protein [Nitrospirae bacterium]|nr:YdcF family protein [Nitrospirota bacterium]